jgi:hypothetical protein
MALEHLFTALTSLRPAAPEVTVGERTQPNFASLNPGCRLWEMTDHRFVESSVKASDCWNRMASDAPLAAPASAVPSIW